MKDRTEYCENKPQTLTLFLETPCHSWRLLLELAVRNAESGTLDTSSARFLHSYNQ